MEREFEVMEKRIPKDLIKEYATPEGGKVREVGPMVYAYSMTVGPDGKPRIREFRNVKPSRLGFSRPEISGETESLIDVTTTDKEVKVIVEMPGVSKDKIKVNASTILSKSKAKILKGNIIELLKYHRKQM